MQTRLIPLENLEIHELATLTPSYTTIEFNALKESIQSNGQQVPVVTYRGKVIDGRHRVKAMRELGCTEISAVSEDSKLSIADIENKILHVYENRRHQTPTQKAILAYRQWTKHQTSGEKMGQGAVAELYGTTRLMLSRAKTFHEIAGDDLLEHLFQGNKVNVGTSDKPRNTDSLATLITFFKTRTEEVLLNSDESTISSDFTDDEMTLLINELDRLELILSKRMLNKLSSMLYSKSLNK